MQPQDPRRALECAEHHDDAAVLAQVRDRLGAAADEVQVGERVVIEQPQRPDRALWRDVDVAVVAARRGADEEHRLALDPAREERLDPLEDLCHGRQGRRSPTVNLAGNRARRRRAGLGARQLEWALDRATFFRNETRCVKKTLCGNAPAGSLWA